MDSETVTQEQIKISVFTPFLYLGIMGGIFAIFASFYKKHRLAKLTKVEPIFEDNFPLQLYLNLKASMTSLGVKPDEKLLKAALLRRGAEAVRRSMKLKENEAAYQRLYQEGLIGDEVYKQYEFETKFQELEIKEIVQEVESIKPGWSQTFFATVQEVCFNEALRRRLYSIEKRKTDLAEFWGVPNLETEKITVNIETKPAPAEKASGKAAGKTTEKAAKKVTEKANKVEPVEDAKSEAKPALNIESAEKKIESVDEAEKIPANES